VAITGATGSGKTTLLRLIAGLQTPHGGRIALGSRSLVSASPETRAALVALVAQEAPILQGTVRDNISVGGAYPPDAIVAAAKLAGAHDFIMGLPDAYDTHVAERGVTLSGGQRQRIALARAFLRPCPILLLDEATASLDGRTEGEVFEGLRQLTDRIVLVVAHRLATLRLVDEVAVLDHGRIVECGTYAELRRHGREFAALTQVEGALAR
jgi:ABC-type multidrug transport system fused ATPase/permease subunit